MHRSSLATLILCAAVSLAAWSCYISPKPIYRFSPTAEETTWLFGQEYTSASNDTVAVAVAFVRACGEVMVFDVEIANLSQERFEISPDEFYYTPHTSLEDATARQTVYAIDPEIKLLELDKRLSKENADYASAVAMDGTLTILDLFADLLTIGETKTEEEVAQEHREELTRKVSQIETEHAHKTRVKSLNAVRGEWTTRVLRRTTLGPGQSVSGQVHFPITDGVGGIEVTIPAGDYQVSILFTQTRYEVK